MRCPYHALRLARTPPPEMEYDDFVLFGTINGDEPKKLEVVKAMRTALRDTRVSGHSLRRAGAQSFARRGMEEWKIEFIGRWGSTTVKRYTSDSESYHTLAAGFSKQAWSQGRAEAHNTNVVDTNIERQ